MKKSVASIALILVSAMFGCGLSTAATLRAGAARVSITTPAEEFPYSVPREKSFVGVHDDVFARALILDTGARRLAIVSLEQTTVPNAEALTKAIATAASVPATQVLLVATHTHNVPLTFFHGEITSPTQPREMQRVTDGAVQAVREAISRLQPARIAWARGQAFVNTNNGEESNRKGWYDPAASSDKSLDVVRVVDASGKPIAALLNYATHAEVMFRSVTRDGGYEVSGDLPGATSRILENLDDGVPVVLFTSAAEGDQLPLFKSLQPAAELPGSDEGAAGWGLLDVQARRLASAALGVMSAMPPGKTDVRIRTISSGITCPGQKFEVERPSGKILGVSDTAPVTIPLMAIRIDDFALAGVGADIASNIGVNIKAKSPVSNTTVVTMLAGSIGYVLNDAAFVHPGHGALGSPVKPGCAPEALATGVAKMLGDQDR